jgi:hypothetical protein
MEKKKILCGGCGKPIHIDEFGGIINGKYIHNKLTCMTTVKEKKLGEK